MINNNKNLTTIGQQLLNLVKSLRVQLSIAKTEGLVKTNIIKGLRSDILAYNKDNNSNNITSLDELFTRR